MKLKYFGLFGVISLLSYTSMVVFSPLAYPGYHWLSRAISDLTAVGAPSLQLAERLNALFGPCAVVSIMAVCVAVSKCESKQLKMGIACFALMEWMSVTGYKMFPLIEGQDMTSFSNIMHIVVTVIVVLLSIISLILIMIGTRHENMYTLRLWAIICFIMMMTGAIGTGIMPKAVFGLFERFSTFSVVIFNAVLGIELYRGAFPE